MLEKLRFKKDWRCFKEGFEIKFDPMTMLVGDQGTGKSSILTLLRDPKSFDEVFEVSGEATTLSFDFEKDNLRKKGYITDTPGLQAASMMSSHGEANLAVLKNIDGIKDTTLIMDEPDMALSIRSILNLVDLFKRLLDAGNQVITSAHNILLIQSFGKVTSLEHGKFMSSKQFIKELTGGVKCIVQAEGEFSDTHSFATKAELDAFSDGVSVGSGHYGAGHCAAYTKEELQDEMDDTDWDEKRLYCEVTKEDIESAIKELT